MTHDISRRNFLRNGSLGTVGLAVGSRLMAEDRTARVRNHSGGEGSPVRIAVVQQHSNHGKVEENRAKAIKFAGQALNDGADIVLFHEGLLVGYVDNYRELAEPLEGETTRAFQGLLKNSDSIIVYGLTEKEGDAYYISAPVVSARKVIANYRKTHLYWKGRGLMRQETRYFSAGDKLVTFDFRGYKIGIMICYDGDFPETARSYANMGCEIVLWLNNRGAMSHEEVKPQAERNSLIIAATCVCGMNEMGAFCRGGSNITDAGGNLLAEIWDDEGYAIADVYPDTILALRKENDRFLGQRGDLYYYIDPPVSTLDY
jgi:predicted amidohydrolase